VGRQPTPRELDKLVEAEEKEGILNREGLALGLGKDDEIVRRRMARVVGSWIAASELLLLG
jgi:hypothetical protein